MSSNLRSWSSGLVSLAVATGLGVACTTTPTNTTVARQANDAAVITTPDTRVPLTTADAGGTSMGDSVSPADAAPVMSVEGRPCTTHPECGAGAYCKGNTVLGAGSCVLYTGPSAEGTGQAGALCDSAKGVNNPDCDGAQGFKCFGVSPTDANAMCALYDCKADSDCGPGRFCGAVNTTPSADTLVRAPGVVVKVCQITGYCGSCVTDLDCAPRGSEAGRCVLDEKNAGYCTYACTKDAECPLDARCARYTDGTSACIPYAGVCKGNGTMCSPCAADSDCTDGECLRAEYSTERYCSQRTPCVKGGNCKADLCTTKPRPSTNFVGAGCTDSTESSVPANQCVGLVQLGTDNAGKPLLLPGCWTRRRP